MSIDISFLLSALRNAEKRGKLSIQWKRSARIVAIVKILQKEGFINYFLIKKQGLKIYLKHQNQGNTSIGKCLRKTLSSKEVWRLSTKSGSFILDTTKGILSDRVAKKQNLGGQVLFYLP